MSHAFRLLVLGLCLFLDDDTRGKSPEASLQSIQVEPGFRVELAPPSLWSRIPSPSNGGPTASSGSSRWATIRWVSTARESLAAWSASSKIRKAMADTTSRPTFLDGLGFPTGLMPWRRASWSPAPPISSTPRTATATARPTTARCSSRALSRGTSSTGSTASSWASTAGSMAPTATAAARSARTRRERRRDQRPRLPVPARHRRVRGRERPDPVRPSSR